MRGEASPAHTKREHFAHTCAWGENTLECRERPFLIKQATLDLLHNLGVQRDVVLREGLTTLSLLFNLCLIDGLLFKWQPYTHRFRFSH